MNAVSKWYHKRPKSYYPKCVEMFGEPTSISNTKHGFAFWKTRGLFDEHILRDEDVKHCVPRNHHDYFYSSIKFFIPEDKVFDVLKISGSINYDGLKNLITARCGGIGANYATLYLGMMVAMGKMTIKEVQSDDLYPKHISGEMKTYNEMKKEMMIMKRANREKFKKELKQDFAPYAFKQCYKEKSGGGNCIGKTCNDKEIEGIRHQTELAEEELAKRDKEQQDQELLRELKHALYTEKEKYGNWVFVPPEKLEKGKKYTVEVTRNMSDSKMPNPLLKQNMEFVRSDNLSDEPLLRFIEGKDNDGNDKYFAVRNTRDNRIYKLKEYGDTSLEDQIKNSKSTDELHALSKEALNKATNFNADLNRYIGEFGGSRTKTSSKGTLRKKEKKNRSKTKSKGTQKSKSSSKEKRVGKGLINTHL